jgi:hypothetical protein
MGMGSSVFLGCPEQVGVSVMGDFPAKMGVFVLQGFSAQMGVYGSRNCSIETSADVLLKSLDQKDMYNFSQVRFSTSTISNIRMFDQTFNINHKVSTIVSKCSIGLYNLSTYFRHLCRMYVLHLETMIFISFFSTCIIFTGYVCYVSGFQCQSKPCTLQNNSTYADIAGGSALFSYEELKPYFIGCNIDEIDANFKFQDYVLRSTQEKKSMTTKPTYMCDIPMHRLISKLKVTELTHIAACHTIYVPSKSKILQIQTRMNNHMCESCPEYVVIFEKIDVKEQAERKRALNLKAVLKYQKKQGERYKITNLNTVKKYKEKHNQYEKSTGTNLNSVKEIKPLACQVSFPPPPPSLELQYTVISNACKDMDPTYITESGCAVCGQLIPICDLKKLTVSEVDMELLIRSGVTRKERSSIEEPVEDMGGPVIESTLDNICKLCYRSMVRGKVPNNALANGKWIGKIPEQLLKLSFAEKLLISRVRHNYCVVRVSSGMHKMRANAISFANPIPKVYDILPPPLKELDDVLAFIFTGPCKPTEDDFKRTPLLVRRNKVKAALEWLKLNHCDYYDLEISIRNLNEYPEYGVPVIVDYRKSFSNKDPEATAVNDNEEEEGTEEGECPFSVHGLTGTEYADKTPQALKAMALRHLTDDRKILAVGHAPEPESIYGNPQLFPKMMPWLFPYGLGGVGNNLQLGHISDIAHKRLLLMYYDKRFQIDTHFPLIAFNHEQIKQSTRAGYLLAEKSKFIDISQRLICADNITLNSIARRMEDGEKVTPETEEEKICFQLIKDLDHVGGHVDGSVTVKKHMRNEIWSLISFLGAPSWFITFSPADVKHPICLYYADTQEVFQPELKRSHDERYRLIAHNPVAGARFFHFMCQIFIRHILGIGADHPGIYGNTSAYYGTVEQQGRVTLHLHLLLWIVGSLSPQDIREKILDPNSDFQCKLVEYLESVHAGEFITGSMENVKLQIEKNMQNNGYEDPTETLPESPLLLYGVDENNESAHSSLHLWWDKFKGTVDDLIFRSNVHRCRQVGTNNDKTVKRDRPTCINSLGKCKARFPRQLFEQTVVDLNTGALHMKKGEAWVNTFTPIVTYLLRCNTDVTSLLSGTAIKAVVAYISDYVTKPGLRTYGIFDAIRGVLDRNSEMLGGSMSRKEKARQLITKIVNSLTAKMEIGGPMASLYLLGNPDHYKSHQFVRVFWKNYVREVMKTCTSNTAIDIESGPDKVVIHRTDDTYVGFSSVHDYIYRPNNHNDKSLYEWVQMARRIKKSQSLRLLKSKSLETTSKEISHNRSHAEDVFDIDPETESFSNIDFETETLVKADKVTENQFLRDHPFYKTHVAQFDPRRSNIVPDFVGGSLPRCDHGDREYYCATMLTLFKPWRSGRDLKSEGSTWDDAFVTHEFSARQVDLMKLFNLRYECNDARDDFSAQLHSGDDVGLPVWINGNDYNEHTNGADEMDNINTGDNFGNDGHENEQYGIERYSALSSYGKILESQMDAVENSVKKAGWLDVSPDGIHPVVTIPIALEIYQTHDEWNNVIKTKKQEILAMRNKNNSKFTSVKHRNVISKDHNMNSVRLIDQSYLNRNFIPESAEACRIIDHTVEEFNLNVEQERAFRIVANHSTSHKCEQLKMYLGGMGGTGKSQVIKALRSLFEQRGEAHRFLVFGPTGTSAALLGGSTYHSGLGIYVSEYVNEGTNISQLKGKLDGVDYIFIDEISMISCRQLYKIGSQLAKALGVYDLPFGGMNVIFAGDFAQLPPVGGSSLFSGFVGTQEYSSTYISGQEAAIGKALWHQITTVVILRENMRQKDQSAEDASLRTALVNMRYGACTEEDIAFLCSRIAGKCLEQPKVASKNFRNVAIICGLHTQKDRINELGCRRFADDTNQQLTHFYSIDRWSKETKPHNREKKKRSWGNRSTINVQKPIHESDEIDVEDQLEVWKLHPGRTGHLPGKLSLCIGMPVIIRYNYATELCITNGQEGFVAGWQGGRGLHGRLVLDVLFVKLDRPPQIVKIDGLPENIVPITRTRQKITCKFPSGLTETIQRQQVSVLPNFAMTVYASQGKTRPFNVIHLNSCRDHMAYYTALSRSATASGTVIIQGFDSNIITKGCSGYLRQEFREQELLDDITRSRYEGHLPSHIDGSIRNTLIYQYRRWRGAEYEPEKMDVSLRWSSKFPFPFAEEVEGNSEEKMTQKLNVSNSAYVAAKGTYPVGTKRRKLEECSMPLNMKKSKLNRTNIRHLNGPPIGLVWDGDNYSCPYDSLFVIFYNIWIQDPMDWSKRFKEINENYLGILGDKFNHVLQGKSSLEDVRDQIRVSLHHLNPNVFPMGHIGASVDSLAEVMLRPERIVASSQVTCTVCEYKEPKLDDFLTYVVHNLRHTNANILQYMQRRRYRESCPVCGNTMTVCIFYNKTPVILMFSYDNTSNTKVINKIQTFIGEESTIFHLRGLIYSGGYHFTSRIVSLDGQVWYHDGIRTGGTCLYDGKFKAMSDTDLKICRERELIFTIYAIQ